MRRALAVALAACLIALPAAAQNGEPGSVRGHKVTVPLPQPNPNAQTPLQLIDQAVKAATNTTSAANAANGPCDFNLFAGLQAQNLAAQLAVCGVADVQTALDSATTANDKVGVLCLTPTLALVQALAGVVPGAQPAASTSPSPTAGKVGLITLFQKFREFTLAAGPQSCRSWVMTTLAASNPLAQ